MTLLSYFWQMWELAINGELQGIWFWAAVYMLLVCGYSLVYQVRTRAWPFTKGQLLGLDVSKFGATERDSSAQDYVAEALYRYTIDGVEYTGTRISPWIFVASHNARSLLQKQLSAIQRYPDGRVKVFYHPVNPQKAFLILPGWLGIAVTSVLGILPLLTYYLKYHY
ncbi:DUF3592 domain-containing protein [Aliiglaciecola sp. CAU 1673]|uniref:DUF3592 domain-containing protein n=1 Tax=Aliiglaciecola sp. CAU 1673 TaxID=3032595 RepID=UPI0023D99D19|nr:DUF3592 domain-containing protein [Aliiglaciecola sp. CAU 1673]MDF2179768.1 DUF3592 domain-containing protein [Aliiglaciecola sp. CAU 1673]